MTEIVVYAIMVGTTIVALPTLIVFTLFQKYFIKGITVSGVKG